MIHFFVLAVLQLLELLRVLHFELGFDVVVGGEDPIHVLLCLLLGLKQTHLGPIDLVLETGHLLLKVGVLSGEEVFVLVKQVDLPPEPLVMAFNVIL